MPNKRTFYSPQKCIKMQRQNEQMLLFGDQGFLEEDVLLIIIYVIYAIIIIGLIITATCFSNVAVMGSLGVRPSVRLSVCNVGGLWSHTSSYAEFYYTVN